MHRTFSARLGRARLAACLAVVALAACAPRLSPPYRDYEVRSAAPPADLTASLADAARAAGWTLAPGDPPGIVSTAARRVATGAFSTTDAALDLVPLDGGYVRVLVRGERRSLLGGRTKVFTLTPSLRQAVLGPLSEALAARGLVALGTPRDRDEAATE